MITREQIVALGWKFEEDVKNNNFDWREKHEVYTKDGLWFTRSLEADYIEIQNENKMLAEGFLSIPSPEVFQTILSSITYARHYPKREKYRDSQEGINVPEETCGMRSV